VAIGKGRAVRELLARKPVRAALYAGDDVTDLDAFAALAEVEIPVRVGVRSDEGPREIVEQADLVVDGIPGMQQVLAELDHP
jgi:trehalose 6-phosphate phosphatase